MKRFILVIALFSLILAFIAPSFQVFAASPDPIYQSLASGHRVAQEQEYVSPENPTVYLTFDDGPTQSTPKVLDILKEEGVLATFFVLGQLAEQRPEIIQRIVSEGHSLGNHTYNHEYKQLYGHFDDFWQQIQQTEEILYAITGLRPSIMRAPGGTHTNFDAFYFYLLEQAGYQVHDWNIDSGDSKRRGVPAQEIINIVKRGPFPHEVNLLMHDGAGHGETVKALPEIIRFFKAKGYSFAPLTDKVKPLQFSLKQNKWQRTVDYDTYKSSAELIREHIDVDLQGEEQLASHGQALLVEASTSLLRQPARLITRQLLDLKLNKNRMEIGNNSVPLRALIEQMGGSADWDEQRRMATIKYDLYTVEYHIETKTVKVVTPYQKQKTIYNADFIVKDGSIIVSLRDILGLLEISNV